MAALDALVQERLKQDKDDRCAKQANRIRLIADPNMSVQGLQVCVKNFLNHKQTQDLWLCISHHQEPLAPMGGIHLHMLNG